MRAQARVLALEALGVAARPGEAGDAVGGAAFGVVLGAGRAASGLRVASYLADLLGSVSVVMYLVVLQSRVIVFQDVCVSSNLSESPTLPLFLSISPPQFLPIPFEIVPCICRRLGQCGWRRPSCGRWRRARRLGHIRCAGPVANVSAAWAGRHRRRQGASQAWPASSRDATATGDDDDVTNSRFGSQANCWLGLATSVSPARAGKPGGRKNPE
jgi:hypothetical protein